MIIAIDIGSSKIHLATFNKNQSKILNSIKIPNPGTDVYDAVDVLSAALASHYDFTKVEQIVIGIPGMVKDNKIAWCPNLGPTWTNYDLAGELTKVFEVPVTLENDANLAGIAETRGLSPVPKSAIYLGIGGGIGSSIIIDGSLDPALLHSEAGMIPLEYDGKLQRWEEFASAKAVKDVFDQKLEEVNSVAVWQSIAERIARGILMLGPIIQPEIVIIGGKMGVFFDNYADWLAHTLDRNLPEQLERPQLAAATYPDVAVLHGAYLLATKKDLYLKR